MARWRMVSEHYHDVTDDLDICRELRVDSEGAEFGEDVRREDQ